MPINKKHINNQHKKSNLLQNKKRVHMLKNLLPKRKNTLLKKNHHKNKVHPSKKNSINPAHKRRKVLSAIIKHKKNHNPPNRKNLRKRKLKMSRKKNKHKNRESHQNLKMRTKRSNNEPIQSMIFIFSQY